MNDLDSMSLPDSYATVIHESEAELVSALRIKEYSKASGFHTSNEAIEWNRSDDQCVILGIRECGELVSTMRVELVDSQSMLETKLECPWEYGEITYPAMILSKAATSSSHRGRGLNTALRYWSLVLSQKWGVRYVVGTFVADSPRQNLMSRMGYEFYENPLGWFAHDYRSTRKVLVAKLDLQVEGRRAREVTSNEVGISTGEFPWVGNWPDIRIVNVVK
jgi:hypothetical protein